MRFWIVVFLGVFVAIQTATAQRVETSGDELFHREWKFFDWESESSKQKTRMSPESRRQLGNELQEAIRAVPVQRRAIFNRFSALSRGGEGDGLGPLHNATSCAECHVRGGASGVKHNVTLITVDPRSRAVTRPTVSAGKHLLRVFPALLNELGQLNIESVVHDASARDPEAYQELRNGLLEFVPGGIPDTWFQPAKRTIEAIADQPVYAGRYKFVDFYLSQRNSPPLFGMGYIDKIPISMLTEQAKLKLEETDGRISGRVANKFGWRGQIPSLEAFVVQACAGELGLTSVQVFQAGDPLKPRYQPTGVDMHQRQLSKLVKFVSEIQPPKEDTPANQTFTNVYRGEKIFNSIGCVDCHVADMPPAMNVFSDFLLHDMGERLQAPSPASMGSSALRTVRLSSYKQRGPVSGAQPAYYSGTNSGAIPAPYPIAHPETPQFPRGEIVVTESRSKFSTEGDATPAPEHLNWDSMMREWRTPPLWGIAGTGPYLHDGRAQSIEAAVLWHGGEAQASRDAFERLSESKQSLLLTFLNSLGAPVPPPSDPFDAAESSVVMLLDSRSSGPTLPDPDYNAALQSGLRHKSHF